MKPEVHRIQVQCNVCMMTWKKSHLHQKICSIVRTKIYHEQNVRKIDGEMCTEMHMSVCTNKFYQYLYYLALCDMLQLMPLQKRLEHTI
jgi:IS30 family transposase